MTDDSMQTITTDIEEELFNEIVNNLEQASITVEEAQQLARDFLTLLPLEDKKDLLKKLYTLSQKHNEARKIYIEYAAPYEEEERQKRLTLISQHLKSGKIEDALAAAKEGNTPATDK
jgi:hypothetical protein